MHKIITLIAFIGVFLVPNLVMAEAEVGTVTRLQNNANVVRDGQTLPLKTGSAIHENDEIVSAKEARIEITFMDETILTIGENSTLVIDQFLYDPKKSVGRILLDAAQGPFRFISGGIGKMKDKRAEVKTSSATIGIRGTDFWGGPSAGTYGIFLIEGIIIVRNAEGGRILTASGTGVNLQGADVAPGEVSVWGKSRVSEAVSSVTFK
ncbi:FecR domain-containing protein [Sneathiella marina]|uniref:FecR domain-containing protein n=1 Tax=Sneathiella marina TaxID=2950108 RepID=A0ABY4W886_9PROT|nr:FecR domain-containing protein [Sneathiella marina]USG61489.1 FecR domain-containing protein [Sneathiella marina]